MQTMESLRKNGLQALGWAIAAWILMAAILLPVLSAILWKSGNFSVLFGYAASALCFAAAVSAGRTLKRNGDGIWTVLSCAVLLVAGLLTIGYWYGGENLNPSAILSLCTFTAAGFGFGYFMSKEIKKETRAKRFHYQKTITK